MHAYETATVDDQQNFTTNNRVVDFVQRRWLPHLPDVAEAVLRWLLRYLSTPTTPFYTAPQPLTRDFAQRRCREYGTYNTVKARL